MITIAMQLRVLLSLHIFVLAVLLGSLPQTATVFAARNGLSCTGLKEAGPRVAGCWAFEADGDDLPDILPACGACLPQLPAIAALSIECLQHPAAVSLPALWPHLCRPPPPFLA